MQRQLKVTFDKNVYEFVVNPEKEAPIKMRQRDAFKAIHYLIMDKKILPFISETILTYETVGRKDRFKILTHDKPIVVTSNGSRVTVSSNPKIHPGNHSIDNFYLAKAINMGFKILPERRFGKLINPAIKSEWYHYLNEEYLITSEQFSSVVKEIELLGAGYKQYSNLITTKENEHLSPYDRLKLYKGSEKKLNAAIAEWSDGDSIALHIVHGLDCFCTNDEGKNAGANSALLKKVCKRLNLKYQFQKKSPEELAACFSTA
jgi:hypothetical protein